MFKPKISILSHKRTYIRQSAGATVQQNFSTICNVFNQSQKQQTLVPLRHSGRLSYATTLVRKSKWFWLLSSQKYIFIIILFIIFKSYIHYTRYQENIFLLNILRKWFSNQNRNHLHFESRYSFIFCEPQGFRNRGRG